MHTPINLCLLLNILACLSFSNRLLRSIADCSLRSIGKSSLYILISNAEINIRNLFFNLLKQNKYNDIKLE